MAASARLFVGGNVGRLNAEPLEYTAKVVDGESDLLVELWGEQGRHALAPIGVASLRRDAPVEIEVIVRIRE